jgi:hypothetical protein
MAILFPFEIIPYLTLALVGLFYCMLRFNTPEYGKASVYISGVLQVGISAALALAFTNGSIAPVTSTSTIISNTGLSAVFALWGLLMLAYTVMVWLVSASKEGERIQIR